MVDEDSGLQSIKFWAKFDPGSPHELDQRRPVYQVLNVSNPDLFAELPQVSATFGTLTYKPAWNAHGESTFDVIVRDSGGTADGGVDTALPQRFTITVRQRNSPPHAANDHRNSVKEEADL